MRRKATILRMTATILAGTFFCAGIGDAMLAAGAPRGVPDEWIRQIVAVYAVGGALLGLIYGRFIEGCLKGPHPQWTFSTDVGLVILGLICTLILVSPAYSTASRPTFFGVFLLLASIPTMIRVISVSSEVRRIAIRTEMGEQT